MPLPFNLSSGTIALVPCDTGAEKPALWTISASCTHDIPSSEQGLTSSTCERKGAVNKVQSKPLPFSFSVEAGLMDSRDSVTKKPALQSIFPSPHAPHPDGKAGHDGRQLHQEGRRNNHVVDAAILQRLRVSKRDGLPRHRHEASDTMIDLHVPRQRHPGEEEGLAERNLHEEERCKVHARDAAVRQLHHANEPDRLPRHHHQEALAVDEL
mmetsp:Transcript_132444/g.411744  ORF Transcript_132444/g.411744 Transcript_132444/m.411744 type:complete len:211 (+) Transcript_132444:306-938(+)